MQPTKEDHRRPQVTVCDAPRFSLDTDREALLKHLEEEGYAVVASVANEDEIQRAEELLWDFLEAFPQTNVRRDDVKTWGCKYDWLPNPSNGIINGFGFGHSDFIWHLRMLRRVKESFALIWKTDDLLVSFDGGNVFRPWRYDPSWRTEGGWYHCDQNARLASSVGLCCVQGLVTLKDATKDTGGLVVIPKSHREHQEICRRSVLAKGNGDFVPVCVGDPILEKGPVLVTAKAGDLILWDSRTVHCNTPALTSSESSEALSEMKDWELLREVGYVCMTPAGWATEEVLEQRRKAYEEKVSTSHWPHKFAVAGYPLPGTPPNDPEAISQEQRRLIGYDRPRRSWCSVQ